VLINIVTVIASYLLGSMSFAVIISRAMHLPDPYQHGSGNPGATNVLRTGNKKAAVLTLLGDALKGAVAVLIAATLAEAFPETSAYLVPAAALAVFLGHLFPIFHRFRGGKGVATAAGIIFALNWKLGLLLLAIWLIIAVGFKISSLAALVAALALLVSAFWLYGNSVLSWMFVIMVLLLIWRHKDNIARLRRGKEERIQKDTKP
jgi:acyl-phosphate glycerol 3-phosphate acyltransferase